MQEFLGRAFSMGEMRALTPKDVKPVYKKLYSDKVRFDDLPSLNPDGRITVCR